MKKLSPTEYQALKLHAGYATCQCSPGDTPIKVSPAQRDPTARDPLLASGHLMKFDCPANPGRWHCITTQLGRSAIAVYEFCRSMEAS